MKPGPTACKFIHCNSNAKLLIVIRFTRNKIGESPTHSSILLQIEPKCPNNNVLNMHTSCHSLCIIYLYFSYYYYEVCTCTVYTKPAQIISGQISKTLWGTLIYRAKRSVHTNFEGHILPRAPNLAI